MPGLPKLMKSIADKIIDDDWFESESPDGVRSFYVLGAEAYWDDVRTGGTYTTCIVPPGPKVGPLAEHVVRSQVAGSRPEAYLKRERRRLEKAGVSAAAIDRVIGGDSEALGGLFPAAMPFEESLDFLLPFLEALRVSMGAADLDHKEAGEIDVAREKLCLLEVVRRYAKIVDKWEQLDELPLYDSQLEEASKAYLYGFYRASVVLSASALEKHLKRAAGPVRCNDSSELVEEAAARLGMGMAWIDQAKHVFWLRNRVVHDGHGPTPDEAKLVLVNARGAIASLV